MASKGKLGTREKQDKWRESISTTKILKSLQNHIDGKSEMKSTQIRAAEILLNRTLPLLKQLEGDINLSHEGEINIKWDKT